MAVQPFHGLPKSSHFCCWCFFVTLFLLLPRFIVVNQRPPTSDSLRARSFSFNHASVSFTASTRGSSGSARCFRQKRRLLGVQAKPETLGASGWGKRSWAPRFSPLKINGWKMKTFLGWPIFRGLNVCQFQGVQVPLKGPSL